MTDWKARCAELADRLDDALTYTVQSDTERSMRQLITRTRAALAQPEPEGPTDEELDIVVIAIQRLAPDQPDGPTQPTHDLHAVDRGREILKQHLARFGRPAIQPVPTPEPGTADHITDDEGTRWDHTMDAALWAKAFCLICPEMASREDVMIGWFANAIMTGWDHRGWKAERKPVPVSDPPRPDELDDQGTCWMFHPVNLHYCLCRPDPSVHTHWLPYWALPVPTSHENP